MNITTLIIILAIILVIVIALNNIQTDSTPSESGEAQASCSKTAFGCCPDGVNSKINFYGTNCPSYNPGPGYQLHQLQPPPPPPPVPPVPPAPPAP